MTDETIPILTGSLLPPTAEATPAPDPSGRKGTMVDWSGGVYDFPDDREAEIVDSVVEGVQDAITEIPANLIEDRLVQCLQSLGGIVQRAVQRAQLDSLVVEEMQVSLGITAKGAVGIQAFGAEGAGASTVVLKLKPKPQSDSTSKPVA